MLAVHTTSTGAIMVCYWCRTGDCSDSVVHGMREDVVCHCKCQPKCNLPECQPDATPSQGINIVR